jgi:hypothetical protein
MSRFEGCPCARLFVIGQARLKTVSLRKRLVGIDTFCRYKTEAAFREPTVVVEHRLCRMAVFGSRDARHRGDCDAVAHRNAVAVVRGKDLRGEVVHFASRQGRKVTSS